MQPVLVDAQLELDEEAPNGTYSAGSVRTSYRGGYGGYRYGGARGDRKSVV